MLLKDLGVHYLELEQQECSVEPEKQTKIEIKNKTPRYYFVEKFNVKFQKCRIIDN